MSLSESKVVIGSWVGEGVLKMVWGGVGDHVECGLGSRLERSRV